MKIPQKNRVKFEVTRYNGKEITTKTLSFKQVRAINLQAYTFCHAVCIEAFGFKDANGNWQDLRKKKNSIGPVAWTILQALQWNAGIGLTKKGLKEATGLWNLDKKGVLTQRIRALRAAFGESKKTECLIRSNRKGGFTLMWPEWATWIWVVRL